MTEQRLTPGWYQWMDGELDHIGKRHYFRVVPSDPDHNENADMYQPLCGAKPKDADFVDDKPPFRDGECCKRCKKLLLYMPCLRRNQQCQPCAGSGNVPEKAYPSGVAVTTCSDCGGTGLIEGGRP